MKINFQSRQKIKEALRNKINVKKSVNYKHTYEVERLIELNIRAVGDSVFIEGDFNAKSFFPDITEEIGYYSKSEINRLKYEHTWSGFS